MRQLLSAVKVNDTVESTLTYVEASPLFWDVITTCSRQ